MAGRQMGCLSALVLGVTALLAWPAGARTWTLEAAITHALEQSPRAQLAAARVAAARAGLKLADAAFWPTLQVGSRYSYTDDPMLAFGAILDQRAFSPSLDFNDVPATDNLRIEGTLRLSLFAGGAHLAGRRAAQAAAGASEATAEAVRRDLALEVTRAFFAALKARAMVEATSEAVAAFELNLELAKKRHLAGALLRADLLEVELGLLRAREEALRARHGEKLTQQAFRALLALPEEPVELAAPPRRAKAPGPREQGRRAELLASERAIDAADASAQAARGRYWPQLDAFASLSFDHGWRTEGSKLSFAVGLGLQWQLWDGLATRAKVAAAAAAVRQARQHHRALRTALDLELSRNRSAWKEAGERLAVAEQAVRLATERAELTRARFEQARALASNVVDAETALTFARLRRAEAAADQQIALAALRRAAGLAPR